MTIEEIKKEIAEAKQGKISRSNVNDLAVLMYVYNNWDMSRRESQKAVASELNDTISYDTSTEFGELVDGKKASDVMAVFQELMDAVLIANPKLYNFALRRLQEL